MTAKQNRRDFLATTLAAVGAAALRPGVSWDRRRSPAHERELPGAGRRSAALRARQGVRRARGAPRHAGSRHDRPSRHRHGAWVPTEFLRTTKLFLPGFAIFQEMQGATAGYGRFDITPEIKAGLTFRPTEVTARDTLAWFRTLGADRQANLLGAMERDAKLLAAWKTRGGR